uniref:Hypotheticial protein n=1 Tax=Mesocestoides corti TaxID=53468 RepID=A0A5K3FWK6_MESCO
MMTRTVTRTARGNRNVLPNYNQNALKRQVKRGNRSHNGICRCNISCPSIANCSCINSRNSSSSVVSLEDEDGSVEM